MLTCIRHADHNFNWLLCRLSLSLDLSCIPSYRLCFLMKLWRKWWKHSKKDVTIFMDLVTFTADTNPGQKLLVCAKFIIGPNFVEKAIRLWYWAKPSCSSTFFLQHIGLLVPACNLVFKILQEATINMLLLLLLHTLTASSGVDIVNASKEMALKSWLSLSFFFSFLQNSPDDIRQRVAQFNGSGQWCMPPF